MVTMFITKKSSYFLNQIFLMKSTKETRKRIVSEKTKTGKNKIQLAI